MRLLHRSVCWLAGYLVSWVVAYSAVERRKRDGLPLQGVVVFLGGLTQGVAAGLPWFAPLVRRKRADAGLER